MIRHIYPEGYENTELYKLYPELYQAVFIDKRNIYISGPGGTGKSYSIGLIKKECNRLRINCSLTATTGVAAHGLGNGTSTIHRWSSINLGDKPAEVITKNIRTNKERSRRWKDTDVLVIDEVSMLGSQILTLIDRVGKDIRIGKRETKKLLSEKMPIPCFGGIQVILSGDFLQLMPIGDDFCFKSPVWNELNLFYFRMTFPYRYPDENHFSLLSRVRVAKHTEEDIEAMRERVKVYEEYRKRERDGSLEESIKPTRIYSLKRDVEAINKVELEKLEGDVIAYEAEDTIIVKTNKEGVPIVSIDNLNTTEYMDYMDSIVDKEIMMKTGSQVLLTKNISVDDGLVNGSRGVVIGCYDERITVKFKSGAQVDITPYNYEFEDDKVTVIRTQFPLILCWALTTHKIQGSTLDYAIIDIGTSIFSAGQAYVSLSRCRRLKDIMIINVMPEKIKADSEALEFEEKMTKISVLAKPIESVSKTGKDEVVASDYPENPGEGSSCPYPENTGELSESDEEGESLSEIVWVDGGCNDLTAPEGWGSVVNDKGRDILSRKDVLPIIKDLKHRVEVLPEGLVSLGGPRTVLISNFTDVNMQQNNGAELLAMVAALRIAGAFPIIKVINCDSNLLCLWWSKGEVSKGAKKNIDKEKLSLIEECGILRRNFEARGGKIVKVKGSENKADLGMHK